MKSLFMLTMLTLISITDGATFGGSWFFQPGPGKGNESPGKEAFVQPNFLRRELKDFGDRVKQLRIKIENAKDEISKLVRPVDGTRVSQQVKDIEEISE